MPGREGKAGCGCLVFLVAAGMVIAGLTMHPLSLKFLGNQFRYEDKIFAADVVYVPRFPEDRQGELFEEAFREYGRGNAKSIWVEDDKILGTSIVEFVQRLARSKGVKDTAIHPVSLPQDRNTMALKAQDNFVRAGFRKVIIVVPDYASRRFHLLFGSGREDKDSKVVYMIKPANVTFFRQTGWWKDTTSRAVLFNELSSIVAYYFDSFKLGKTEKK